jgi:hypothetical protein
MSEYVNSKLVSGKVVTKLNISGFNLIEIQGGFKIKQETTFLLNVIIPLTSCKRCFKFTTRPLPLPDRPIICRKTPAFNPDN